MALKDVVSVFMYVNPSTNNVEKVLCYTPFGISVRENKDWKMVTREESGIDDLSADKVYQLDWDTDFQAMDAEDDDSEHAAIELYDSGTLTEQDCQKYGVLYIDPNDTSDPELDKLIGQ